METEKWPKAADSPPPDVSHTFVLFKLYTFTNWHRLRVTLYIFTYDWQSSRIFFQFLVRYYSLDINDLLLQLLRWLEALADARGLYRPGVQHALHRRLKLNSSGSRGRCSPRVILFKDLISCDEVQFHEISLTEKSLHS